MTRNVWKYFKAFLVIIFYFLYSTIFSFILKYIGIDVASLNKTINIILLIFSELFLAFILYLIYRKDVNNSFKDYKINFKKYIKFGFKYWILGVLVMIVANLIISYYKIDNATNEVMVENLIGLAPIYMFFSIVITGPFTEEIVFRKSIRDVFFNNFLYIIISGLFFGYVHTIVGGTNELIYIIPYGALGISFAYMYAKTDNILLPITFHMLHNFLIVSFYITTLIFGVSL